jgi:hypothetical protein
MYMALMSVRQTGMHTPEPLVSEPSSLGDVIATENILPDLIKF